MRHAVVRGGLYAAALRPTRSAEVARDPLRGFNSVRTVVADFIPLREGSIITEVALHLAALRDNVIDPMGSAVVIAPHIALTARHVVEDCWRGLDGREPRDGMQGRFSLIAVLQRRDGQSAIPFDVRIICWADKHRHRGTLASSSSGDSGRLQLEDAKAQAGSTCNRKHGCMLRYHDCHGEIRDGQVLIHRDMATATGRVVESAKAQLRPTSMSRSISLRTKTGECAVLVCAYPK